MPWHVAQSAQCPAGKPWGVINENTGEVEGCHASEAAAQEQVAALYAAEDVLAEPRPDESRFVRVTVMSPRWRPAEVLDAVPRCLFDECAVCRRCLACYSAVPCHLDAAGLHRWVVAPEDAALWHAQHPEARGPR